MNAFPRFLTRRLVFSLAAILLVATVSVGTAFQHTPPDTPGPAANGAGAAEISEVSRDGGEEMSESPPKETRSVTRQDVIASLTIFALAVFVGFEVITKVPPTLHAPLMSGSNAISGITLVGALIVAASPMGWFSPSMGFVAVFLATINAVGGFMVTHRTLAMFKR